MSDLPEDPSLSPLAAARRDRMLPDLLRVVRRRRQRRHAVRAGALSVAVGLAVWWSLPRGDGGAAGHVQTPPPVVASAAWSVVRDDPGALERCRVRTIARAEWFVDDAGLQALLAAAERPSGIIRMRRGVRVSPEAVDPWPVPPAPPD